VQVDIPSGWNEAVLEVAFFNDVVLGEDDIA
jgi:hypothetical protein